MGGCPSQPAQANGRESAQSNGNWTADSASQRTNASVVPPLAVVQQVQSKGKKATGQTSPEKNSSSTDPVSRQSTIQSGSPNNLHLYDPIHSTSSRYQRRMSTYDEQYKAMKDLAGKSDRQTLEVYQWLMMGFWDDPSFTPTDINAQFASLDREGKGLITKEDFKQSSFLKQGGFVPPGEDATDYLSWFFKKLDPEGKGAIESKQFRANLGKIQLTVDKCFSLPAVTQNLAKMWNWEFDAFQLDKDTVLPNRTDGMPLTVTAMYVFREFNLFRTFRLDRSVTCNLFREIEHRMRPQKEVPYHNRIHVADVVANMAYFLKSPALQKIFTDIDYLICLLGAAIHDMGHPGKNNMFEINRESELAQRYNDTSVLEHYHLYEAFKLLRRPEFNIFAGLKGAEGKKLFKEIRKGVIDMVLATDMTHHARYLQEVVNAQQNLTEAHELKQDLRPAKLAQVKNTIRIACMKCADIANPAKHVGQAKPWCYAMVDEWAIINKVERSLGMEESPLPSWEKGTVELSQLSFAEIIVQPLYEALAEYAPTQLSKPLRTLTETATYWRGILEERAQVSQKETVHTRRSLSFPNSKRSSLVGSSNGPNTLNKPQAESARQKAIDEMWKAQNTGTTTGTPLEPQSPMSPKPSKGRRHSLDLKARRVSSSSHSLPFSPAEPISPGSIMESTDISQRSKRSSLLQRSNGSNSVSKQSKRSSILNMWAAQNCGTMPEATDIVSAIEEHEDSDSDLHPE